MHIAIIARRAHGINGTGGMERAATEIATGLAHRGHRVEMLTSTPAQDFASVETQPFQVTPLAPLQRRGIRGWIDYRPWRRHVAEHIQAHRPEFIVGFYGDTAELGTDAPLILSFQYGLEWWVTPGVHGRGLRWLYGPIGRRAIRSANYLATCGAVHLQAMYGVEPFKGAPVHITNWKPEVVESATRSEARAQLGLAEDAVILGVVSRLAADKLLDRAIGAVKQLRATYPQLRFVIAGDGPERSTLEALAGDDMGITFLGRVNDSTARLVMRAADATVSVARTQYQMFAVIEALSLGTPVLCAHAERQEGLIKEGVTGFILPTPGQDALERALRRLITMSPEEREAMSIACEREVAEGYSLDDAIDTIERLAQRVIQPPPAL